MIIDSLYTELGMESHFEYNLSETKRNSIDLINTNDEE